MSISIGANQIFLNKNTFIINVYKLIKMPVKKFLLIMSNNIDLKDILKIKKKIFLL